MFLPTNSFVCAVSGCIFMDWFSSGSYFPASLPGKFWWVAGHCIFYLAKCWLLRIPVNILELCSGTQLDDMETVRALWGFCYFQALCGGTRVVFSLWLIFPYYEAIALWLLNAPQITRFSTLSDCNPTSPSRCHLLGWLPELLLGHSFSGFCRLLILTCHWALKTGRDPVELSGAVCLWAPHSSPVLCLSSSSGGLRLPHLTLQLRDHRLAWAPPLVLWLSRC